MNNRPILFVNSFTNNVSNGANQSLYDSRKAKIHEKVKHRIDDICGFLYLQKRVFVTIMGFNIFWTGEIISMSHSNIRLINGKDIIQIPLSQIQDIKVDRLL